jgi:uncharacterized protein (DUF427 family)
VTLTIGTGPFGEHSAGRFNVAVDAPDGLLYFEQIPHRIRAVFAKEVVVDSSRAKLLHESGRLPVYYFPEDDVRTDLLEQSQRREHDPLKGTAAFYALALGERRVPDAAWSVVEPAGTAPWLAGHVAFQWQAIDEWFAEDEQLFGHPRDPYHRIDVYKSTRHVRVVLDGETLADTRRARILFETGLPPRYYVPVEDVHTDLLVPSAKKTRCAYKGSASYWSVRLGDRVVEDIVWTYPDPQHDAEPVRDLLCFFNERVDLHLDDEAQGRPQTQWS